MGFNIGLRMRLILGEEVVVVRDKVFHFPWAKMIFLSPFLPCHWNVGSACLPAGGHRH